MNIFKKYNWLTYYVLLILFCQNNKIFSQSNPNSSIYDWFDNKVGRENLSINNGKLFLNYDKTLPNNHRFLLNEFQKGTVMYDNQIYNNSLINYDIYKDELIFKPENNQEKIALILAKEKVDYFIINNIKFVNIFQNESPINGYFEEQHTSDLIQFYTKHFKYKKELINNDILLDDFIYSKHFAIKYKEIIYEIDSKESIKRIFPNYKKRINEFYTDNDNLKRIDKSKFFENLFKYLNQLLKN